MKAIIPIFCFIAVLFVNISNGQGVILPKIDLHETPLSRYMLISNNKNIALQPVNTSFATFPLVCQPGGCTLLPLTLLEFSGQTIKDVNHLFWKTANEINISHFELQRSPDALLFKAIGTVAAINTGGIRHYSFDDNFPLQGKNYYRLRMMGPDGNDQLSNIVLLQNSSSDKIKIYPNPATDQLFINIDAAVSANTVIEIKDLPGRSLKRQEINLQKGQNQLSFYISSLPGGTYFLDILYRQTNQHTVLKFVKIK